MAQESEKPAGIDRRAFIAGTGALVTGAVSSLAMCAPFVEEKSDAATCRVLRHDPSRCVGCGVCGMMCALYREGEVGPALSRSGIVRDPFSYDFSFIVCQQCEAPQCYPACPLRGEARLVDPVTGIVSVDENACIGCGACIAACNFDPPRTRLHPDRRVALSCDRCKDRDEGPICVAYCTQNALSCAGARPPRRPGGRRA